MQGNNYGLLLKTIKKFPKSPFWPAGRVLSSDKHKLICSSSCQVYEWTLIELPFTLQHDREFVVFRLYLPLFMKLFMVLCVIFKSERYLRAAFWVLLYTRCLCTTENNRRSDKNCERDYEQSITNIIRWNMYRDNNFHSRRQVLRVKCLWKSWVR